MALDRETCILSKATPPAATLSQTHKLSQLLIRVTQSAGNNLTLNPTSWKTCADKSKVCQPTSWANNGSGCVADNTTRTDHWLQATGRLRYVMENNGMRKLTADRCKATQ